MDGYQGTLKVLEVWISISRLEEIALSDGFDFIITHTSKFKIQIMILMCHFLRL